MLSGKFAMDVDLASVPPLSSRRRKDTLLFFQNLFEGRVPSGGAQSV